MEVLKFLRFLAATCALLCLAASTAAFAQTPDEGAVQTVESVTQTVLPNGLRIIVAPRHTVAISAIDIWVRAGTRRQEPGQEGVAHYLEHVLFTGTPTHPTEADIDGAVEDVGGALDGGTSYDWAHFYTIVPSAGFEPALDVMADALQHANISEDSVEEERPIIESEIGLTTDDNVAYAQQQVRAQLYGADHPYGQSITGTPEQVADISRDQILDFYHAYYVPSNVTVVVAGDVTPDQVQAAVASAFGAWKGDAPPAETDLAPPQLSGVQEQILPRPSSDSFIVMGWPAPSVFDQPDVWVMDVLLTYLGQGAENVLDDDLHRTRHLVTSVTADFLTQRDPGILMVTAEMPTGNIGAVKKGILQHVADLQDHPVTDQQLAGAKQELISSYLFDTETVSGKADALGFYDMIDTYRYDVDYIDHIDSVTPDQLQQVARKYLSSTQYAATVIVPPQDPENALLPSIRSSNAASVTGSRLSLAPTSTR